LADGSVQLTLTSTNNGDCDPSDDTIFITFGDTSFASAGDDVGICQSDESIQLDGFASGGSSTGIWTSNGSGTFDDATLGDATYTPSAADFSAGNVELTFTTTNNGSCDAGEDSMILSLYTVPSASAGADQVVCGAIEELTFDGSFNNAEGIAWSTTGTGSFTTAIDQLGVAYLPSEADSIIGQFYMIVSTTGLNACEHVSDSLLVQFGGRFEVDAGEDARLCLDESTFELLGTADGDNLTYTWSTNGAGSLSANNTLATTYTLDPSDAGDITFTLTVQDDLGCPAMSDEIVLTLDALPTVDVSADQVTYCSTIESFPLVGSASNAGEFFWSTSGTGTIEDPLLESTIYFPSEADAIIGQVTFTLQSDPNNDCGVAEDMFTVMLDNSVVADFDYTAACLGDPTAFSNTTAVSSGTVESFTWDFGGLGTSSSENPEWTFTVPGVYDVLLTVQLAEGCSSETTQQIEVTEPPVADFGYNGILLADEDIEFFDLTANSVEWLWEFGLGGDTASVEDPVFEFNFEGEYEVTLIAIDNNGCRDTTVQMLPVLPGDVLPPKTPTGFSPNGDGENDVYYVRGGPFAELKFTIYNGWGEVIFTSTDAAIGWDGTHKGKDVPVGVYVYTVTAKTIDEQEYEKSGKVTLIR